MTVKVLNKFQQSYVCYFYNNKQQTIKELAQNFKVSERTIQRVLIEAGLATPVKRVQEEAEQVMRLINRFNITPITLEKILFNHVKEYR